MQVNKWLVHATTAFFLGLTYLTVLGLESGSGEQITLGFFAGGLTVASFMNSTNRRGY